MLTPKQLKKRMREVSKGLRESIENGNWIAATIRDIQLTELEQVSQNHV